MNKLIIKYIVFSISIICLLIPLSILAQDSYSPIKFSGSNRIYGQYSSRQGSFSQVPASFLREELNLRLEIYGIPLSSSFFLSTEQRGIRQNINTFNFSINPKQLLMNKAKQELYKTKPGKFFRKLMSTFSTIEIGTCRPTYSPLILNGIPVKGVNIEFTPGIFYSAFVSGKTKKRIQNVEASQQTYEQYLQFGKIGLGKKDKSHFYVSFLHVKDDENSMTPDSSFYISRADTIILPGDTIIHNQDTSAYTIKPQENFVAGTEAKLFLFKKKFYLGGELAVSMLTRDMTASDIEINDENVPKWAKDYFNPKVSSSIDYAYSVNTAINLKTTKLSGSYKMVGPGFNSFGTPYLRNDFKTYEAKISQSLLKRKISVSSYFRKSKDNLIDWKNSTTTYTAYGISASFRFRKFPYFVINYSPYLQSNKSDTSEKENKTQIFNFSSGYNYKIKDLRASTNFNYSLQNSEIQFDTTSNNYKTSTYSVYENLSFKKPLSLSFVVSLSNREYPENTTQIYTYGLSGTYSTSKKWRNTFGITLSNQKSKNIKTRIYLNSSFQAWKFGQMSLRAEQNFYRDKEQTDKNYDGLILRVIFTKKF